MIDEMTPYKFVGKAYVEVARVQSNPDCYLCLDAEDVHGIVIRVFTRNEIARAEAMASALNQWAGK